MTNFELENKIKHLEAENEGLKILLHGKSELLKKVMKENDLLQARISMLKGGNSHDRHTDVHGKR